MKIKSLVIELNGEHHKAVSRRALTCSDCSLKEWCLISGRIGGAPCMWIGKSTVFQLVKEEKK